jgi:hypothetical protein
MAQKTLHLTAMLLPFMGLDFVAVPLFPQGIGSSRRVRVALRAEL